jgi:hypothetical protein
MISRKLLRIHSNHKQTPLRFFSYQRRLEFTPLSDKRGEMRLFAKKTEEGAIEKINF